SGGKDSGIRVENKRGEEDEVKLPDARICRLSSLKPGWCGLWGQSRQFQNLKLWKQIDRGSPLRYAREGQPSSQKDGSVAHRTGHRDRAMPWRASERWRRRRSSLPARKHLPEN